MTTFIFDVLNDLKKKDEPLSDLTFILPSKRAGVFLRHQLSEIIEKPILSPYIISIEEFVEELSQNKTISNTELLFEFYNTYIQITKKEETDSFESFSKWAQILLQDFNEIDRYLIPQENIFNYLSAIQDLKHWSLAEHKTEFVKNYLSFWNNINDYYKHFTQCLLDKKVGYQGLIYRGAVNNLEVYIQNNSQKQFVFLGFNALNSAEEIIIQELLQNGMAKIYWDIDSDFLNNKSHDAGLFSRLHKSKWTYFKNNPFNWIANNYPKNKNISVYGIPKSIGQAKYIGSILKKLKGDGNTLDNTAVVLGDENLLIPVLNSIPDSVDTLNITMGFPLKSMPLASLFEQLFYIHKTPSNTFYYKDVITILSHQSIKPLFYSSSKDFSVIIINTIQTNNLIYVTKEQLIKIAEEHKDLIGLLFNSWENSVDVALKNCLLLILIIKNQLDTNKSANLLPLEYLLRFHELFNELSLLNSEYSHIKDVSTLYSVYKEILSSQTLDFQGEPLKGLQIMGMLESRVLDFETVIISSVNEGILPSGKRNNSFIPFDVKLENNLPTYKEKDAVYTYHFYRLLQRAKHIYIIYNTEADTLLGGEKSRFITQLELEGLHKIEHKIVTPEVPIIKTLLKVIPKTNTILEQIKALSQRGFSPSSLTNYIRNPIDYYYQKILNIKEYNAVEEAIAANTLGTVVHNTLDDLYTPYIDVHLSQDSIKKMQTIAPKRILFHFKIAYKDGDLTKGKNLIVFEIAKRYVSNFLNLEMEDLKQGNKIKIKAIEAGNTVSITIPELNFPVKITGKVDRVDEYNGSTRIIDYKTGSVQQSKVEIVNWEDITKDYDKYSKSFQLLTYAYIMSLDKKIKLPVEAGIFSFKNLSSGLLKFSKKESTHDRNKNTTISQDTLDLFEIELKKLIIEICNAEIPFTEKKV